MLTQSNEKMEYPCTGCPDGFRGEPVEGCLKNCGFWERWNNQGGADSMSPLVCAQVFKNWYYVASSLPDGRYGIVARRYKDDAIVVHSSGPLNLDSTNGRQIARWNFAGAGNMGGTPIIITPNAVHCDINFLTEDNMS